MVAVLLAMSVIVLNFLVIDTILGTFAVLTDAWWISSFALQHSMIGSFVMSVSLLLFCAL